MTTQMTFALQGGQIVMGQNGMPPAGAAGGYFYAQWIPQGGPLAPQQGAAGGGAPDAALVRLIKRIHSVMVNALKAFKGVLGEMNSTSDLLRLVINATKFCENTFQIPTLKLFARAFINITDFNSARSWLSRSYDILSGEAAKQEKIWGGWDYLRVSSKAIYLVNDVCTTMKWLVSIGVLGEIVSKEIGVARFFGKAVSVTFGRIGTMATLLGTVPNFIDNIRLVVKYGRERNDMLEKERRWKLVGFSFDTVSDICRVAGTILFLCSNPWLPFLGLVVSTIGTCVSLAKFYYTESTKAAREREQRAFIVQKGAAIRMCGDYMRTAAQQRNDPHVFLEAMNAVDAAMVNLENNRRPQVQGWDANLLAGEILRIADESLPQGSPQQGQINAARIQRNALTAIPVA